MHSISNVCESILHEINDILKKNKINRKQRQKILPKIPTCNTNYIRTNIPEHVQDTILSLHKTLRNEQINAINRLYIIGNDLHALNQILIGFGEIPQPSKTKARAFIKKRYIYLYMSSSSSS